MPNIIPLMNSLRKTLETMPIEILSVHKLDVPYFQFLRRIKFHFNEHISLFDICINNYSIFSKCGISKEILSNRINHIASDDIVYISKIFSDYYCSIHRSGNEYKFSSEINGFDEFFMNCRTLTLNYVSYKGDIS